MKRLFCLTQTIFGLFFSTVLLAQNPITGESGNNSSLLNAPKRRCATTEAIRLRLKKDPAYFAAYQRKLLEFQRSRSGTPQPKAYTNTAKLTRIITIPVVVHIVLPNPQIVTDANVQHFIDRLNLDFSGLNPDSTNAEKFYDVRGHSLIRFALVKRDPKGKPTTGIIRRSSTAIIGLEEPQAIKADSTGGSNPWPFQDYYNIWVGESKNGLLGIAPEIGPGTNYNDGVCINYQAFSNNHCYTDPTFSLARTAVHEIGHNFGLFHIFEGGCDDEDFKQITSENLSLPDDLLADADDTPAQSDETTSCPSGDMSSGCSTSSTTGRMYQNFMDYTEDACYSMFTKGQVERMHYVLEHFRPGYINARALDPVTAPVTLDVSAFEAVNPGGEEVNLNACTFTTYPANLLCSGKIAPKFRVRNNGTTTVTSLTVGYCLNKGNPVTQTITVNLIPDTTIVVSLPEANVNSGINEFKFFTSSPNGQEDLERTNDTLLTTLSVSAPTTATIKEGFESTFPPAGWTVSNPDNSITWKKASVGKNSSGSAFVNNFNYEQTYGQKDELFTPIFQYSKADSVVLTFDLSAAVYSDPTDRSIPFDTLEILVTKDCGNTFTSVYKKGGASLQTLKGPYTDDFFPDNASQWRTERVDLTQFKDDGSIIVAFRNTTNWENNVFIDNVELKTRDLPELLKQKGYLVLPTMNKGSFGLWLYEKQNQLKYIAVFNDIGSLVWKKEFNGNTDAYIPVNLQGRPAGIYFVKWGFAGESKVYTERILIQ